MLAWLTKSALPSSTGEFVITLPDDELWLADFFGALTPLVREENWEQHGTLSPEEMADYWAGVLLPQLQNLTMAIPVGSILLWPGVDPPSGYLLCDGAEELRSDWPKLFEIVGTTFGAASGDTFTLPNLLGRFPLGVSGAHGLATTGGTETVTLSESQIPSHNHPATSGATGLMEYTPGIGTVGFATGSNMRAATVTGNRGGGQSHNNMPPFLSLFYVIKAR